MLSCLTMLIFSRCGSGNLKDRNSPSMHPTWYGMDPSILFHAQRGTLVKKTKFNSLMVDWHSCFHLPQGHSTQLQMWHHVSVILDTNLSKHFFGTSSLFPYMVLFTSINIQKKYLKNSRKPKMHKPSNIINDSFWTTLYSSLLMIWMLKSYPSHVLVLFGDVMDGLGPPFYQLIPLVCWRLQINLQIAQWWKRVCLILCCWMMSPWKLPYHTSNQRCESLSLNID